MGLVQSMAPNHVRRAHRAALRGMFDVPRGCLFRARAAVNAYSVTFRVRCMILFCTLSFLAEFFGFVRKEGIGSMHQALYRKWRPKDFDSVCGQEHITSVLRYEIINNRYSHAYLFCGSRGTGKTTCAKLLAKAVNCLSPENGSPCGKCEACL